MVVVVEAVFSLRAASVMIRLKRQYFPSELLAAKVPRCEPWRSAPRIDLAVHLLRCGWPFGDTLRMEEPRSPDTPYLLDVRWILGAKARLAVLANEVNIFCKGISAIFCRAPQYYHVCLLELENLADIESLGEEVPTKNDDFWKRMLKGKAPLALEDREAPFDAGGEPVVALVPAPMPVVHAVVPDFSRLPLQVTLLDGRVITVHFDKTSHASRRPRCLTVCKLHRSCRRDKFIHTFPSEQRCVAFLAAWHAAGTEFAGMEQGEDHKLCVVQDSAVDEWEERLRPGPV